MLPDAGAGNAQSFKRSAGRGSIKRSQPPPVARPAVMCYNNKNISSREDTIWKRAVNNLLAPARKEFC